MHNAPVVFDLDGTLVDSLQDIAGALNSVLAHLRCTQHPLETIRTMIGGGAQKLLERGLGPANGHKLEEAMDRFRLEYRGRLLDTTRLFPGVEQVLGTLHGEGRTWAIATNKPSQFTADIIEGLGLARLGLTSWASGDEVPAKKPAPDVIALAADRGGFAATPPSAFTYVGDMPVDVACGRRFGCPTVGVMWGFDPPGVEQAGPDHLVRNAHELIEVLRARKETMRPSRRP